MKIAIIAEVPDGIAKDLMQHLRNFDIVNPGCKFSIIANAPDKTKKEMTELLNIQPPLAHKKT